MAQRSHPHILLVTADQHRGDALGCAGHPCVQTPHLNRLAHCGLRFRQAFTDCPICIPARTTLLTGRKSAEYGAPGYQPAFRIDHPRSDMLGSLITRSGYQTALVGKRHWHLDPTHTGGFETVIPIERCKRLQDLACGRDGQSHGLGANELSPSLWRLPDGLYSTDWITDRSMEWLGERDRGRPFMLWTSYVDPHPPLAIHEPYYSMYDSCGIPRPAIGSWCHGESCPTDQVEHRTMYNPDPLTWEELRKARSVYYGMITNIDRNLGRLFGMLQAEGLWDDTLVLYTSDHGELLGDHGDIGKSSFYNAAARIPLIIKPPRLWDWQPGQTSDALVELADLLPTLCRAAGAPIPASAAGADISPIGRGAASVRSHMHGQIDRTHMIHDGGWKYLYHAADGREQLFAAADEDDMEDLAATHRSETERLRRLLTERLAALSHEHLADGRLVNLGRQPRPAHVLRSMNPMGWQAAARMLRFTRPV